MNSILAIENLHVTFLSKRPFNAIKGISFGLKEQECLGIVGESGSGKSTLSKVILNLVSSPIHVSGQIIYRGSDLCNCSEVEMQQIRSQKIAWISQDYMNALNPSIQIGTQIVEGYRKRFPESSLTEAYEKAYEILEELGFTSIPSLLKSYPYQLSGGMLQRVLIAIALIRKPEILIADEALTALNVSLKNQVLARIKKQQLDSKMSLIWISHDLDIVAQFCNRIVVMYEGEIVEFASSQEMFKTSSHPYTQALIKSSTFTYDLI